MIYLHVAVLAVAISWAAWWLLREQWRYYRNSGRIDKRIHRLKNHRWE